MLDNLLATGNRLIELPLAMLVGIGGGAWVLLTALALLLVKQPRRRTVGLISFFVLVVMCLLGGALVTDRKIAVMDRQLRDLRQQTADQHAALVDQIAKRQIVRQSFLFDLAAAQTSLKRLGEFTLATSVYDEATDVIQIRRAKPELRAWMVVVNLEHPAVGIALGTTIQKKRLTSEFARENDCTVAINGEAGRSPDANSGLGDYIGNMIYRGKVILLEDTANRPFMSFNRANRGAYSRAALVDKAVTPERYNVIWGRLDAIIDGQVQTADEKNTQPRTAMGINADGTRLYLMVADGRQPGYSMGLTRAEVGQLLQAFGAHNGMLCDEGGSSCIYLKGLGGIADMPCDNHGQERPTYTHFGITLKRNDGP
jgi:exopolysaccharide biosynthesis protein